MMHSAETHPAVKTALCSDNCRSWVLKTVLKPNFMGSTTHSCVCRNSMLRSSPCRCACTADSPAAQTCSLWSPCGAAHGAQLSATCAATANCIHCTPLMAPPVGTTPWITPNSLLAAQLLALLLLLALHSWQSSATEARAWTAETLQALLCKTASRKALEVKRIWHGTSGLLTIQ